MNTYVMQFSALLCFGGQQLKHTEVNCLRGLCCLSLYTLVACLAVNVLASFFLATVMSFFFGMWCVFYVCWGRFSFFLNTCLWYQLLPPSAALPPPPPLPPLSPPPLYSFTTSEYNVYFTLCSCSFSLIQSVNIWIIVLIICFQYFWWFYLSFDLEENVLFCSLSDAEIRINYFHKWAQTFCFPKW